MLANIVKYLMFKDIGGIAMVTAIILAGGTGQRMGNTGMPKQFLKLYGKPIICYTLQTFEDCDAVDRIVIPCNAAWIGHMEKLVKKYNFNKVLKIVDGGKDRQSSIQKGLSAITDPQDTDVVIIHDGVRPLLREEIIIKNVQTAQEKGNAMTVQPNIETVVVTSSDCAQDADFKTREITYTLTSPQTFRTKELIEAYASIDGDEDLSRLPDAALLLARMGHVIHLVKDMNLNLKITKPEDYCYLKSYLDLNENKQILGL